MCVCVHVHVSVCVYKTYMYSCRKSYINISFPEQQKKIYTAPPKAPHAFIQYIPKGPLMLLYTAAPRAPSCPYTLHP